MGASLSEKEVKKITSSLEDKAQHSVSKLDKANEKYLAKFLKEEKKLYKKLFKKDSNLAKELLTGVEEKYKALSTAPDKVSKFSNHYSSYLDSLTTAFSFLKSLDIPGGQKIDESLKRLDNLKSKLDQTKEIKIFMLQRQQYLKEQFARAGMLKEIKGLNKQVYYYQAQINEYKQLFENPSKIEEKVLALVANHPQFSQFFESNSQIGRLFNISSFGGSTAATASLSGLQTRATLQQAVLVSNPNSQQFLQTQLQSVSKAASQAREPVQLPDLKKDNNTDKEHRFRPNSQKTKSFSQRLEKGANINFGKTNNLLPNTADIALSLGYKLNDRAVVGLETAYKLGLGSFREGINFSHQGYSLRSFLDWKIIGSLYFSGGYERLYLPKLQDANVVGVNPWQESGLIGATKKFSLSNKLKGSFRLLFDFLSYHSVPRRQPIIFRIGYNF